MLTSASAVPSSSANDPAIHAASESGFQALLHRRMNKPQRHRLLHGFPLAAAMPYVSADERSRQSGEIADIGFPTDRKLLVGILPHSFCNPRVAACGFCTFPHEQYNTLRVAAVVNAVTLEVQNRIRQTPQLERRPVHGLYFGGGTANLAPAGPFRKLCRAVNEAFDLGQAEVSLEGIPSAFVNRNPMLVDLLTEELQARHFRISMGIQTFSKARLAQMGRLGFGNADTFATVVKMAHSRGMTVSGDLLFNLPGQTLPEMQQDVQHAVDIGLDQICLYHLVMFRGLAAPWARDEQLLASLPDNETACGHWEVLRAELLRQGYVQTTLTNFERQDLQNDPRRYQYELMSFQPDVYDMAGFGPSGISYCELEDHFSAWKTLNPENSAEYLQAVHQDGPFWNRAFEYLPEDLQLLQMTRNLAALEINRQRYRDVFRSDPLNDYSLELNAFRSEGLLQIDADAIRLTPRGMFYADSMAAMLADRTIRISQNRLRGNASSLNVNAGGHM